MRIKLIEELPMATSAELYQLSWVIEQLLADPRRLVQVRAQLHTGQQIQSEPADTSTQRCAAPAEMELTRPSPPPEVPGRGDFRVGNRVTFTDKNLQHRVGLIVRVNQRTATLDCDGQQWRVGFELLRHLVDV